MKKPLRYGLGLLCVLSVGYAVYDFQRTSDMPRELTALEKVGDECDLIAEKAAMALPEALPFQKLEKVARRARVMQNCMNDRGYRENPAWVKFAEPLALQQAKQQQVSQNEAYESLRRSHMLIFYTPKDAPLYWLAVKQDAQKK
ncbi:MAG TPA: hypothetical protein VGD04_00590 [Methylophilus sp.]